MNEMRTYVLWHVYAECRGKMYNEASFRRAFMQKFGVGVFEYKAVINHFLEERRDYFVCRAQFLPNENDIIR
jgi:hypothetical protein